MEQVWEFFRNFFDTSDFPPRWHCGKWSDFHGWLYIISDLLIWSAYFAIPIIIIRYITRKYNARFIRLYFLFAGFILACGSTHLLDAITFWLPVYRLNAVVRLFTGIISWITVFHLVQLLPKAFSLKTAEDLEAEVEAKRRAEMQLKINNKLLNEAQDIAKIGHWDWDVKKNKIVWSKTLLKLYGLPNDVEGLSFQQFLELMHPEDRDFVEGMIKQAKESKVFPEFYHRVVLRDGTVKTMHSKGEVIMGRDGEVIQMLGTGQDVTKQKEVEQELLLKSQELESTNIELQKFASIASHDLREPLRKTITFASLLEKEYKDQLGERGQLYIEKITTASARMQRMIDDILDFSRVSGTGHTFTKVDLNEIIDQVLADMDITIENTNATVVVDKMPQIEANAGLLGRLFQNLISNSIKFRKDDTVLEIKISAEIVSMPQIKNYLGTVRYDLPILNNPKYWQNEKFCKIEIQDNGIGFDQQYLDRIFLIFQRLHGKGEYEGTGIGLAVCKKVADIHRGYITAESTPGEGATFIVTLPLSQRNFRNI